MYLARLMGYDYHIQYRSNIHNQAADALSRLPEQDPSMFMILSVPCLTFMEELRRQLDSHPEYQHQRQNVRDCPAKHPEFSITHDLVLNRGRIWLPWGLPIISTLLTEYHAMPTGGHIGVAKTLAHITENFYWPGLRDDVNQFVANCVECQVTKYETKKIVGLLCLLPVPYRPWEDLSLDFIVGLSSYHGYTVILVVVDRFWLCIKRFKLHSSQSLHPVSVNIDCRWLCTQSLYFHSLMTARKPKKITDDSKREELGCGIFSNPLLFSLYSPCIIIYEFFCHNKA